MNRDRFPALREGWDNPNVFVLGMLKKSSCAVSRRQEIGRGLRLAIDQRGERTDDPLTVQAINELTGAFRFSDAVLRHLVVNMNEAITEPSPMAKAEDDEGGGGERRRERAPREEASDDDNAPAGEG